MSHQILCCVRIPDEPRYVLACVAKRTYVLDGSRLRVADDHDLIVREPVVLDDIVLDDTDLMAPKAATDVVVIGSAHAPEPVRELYVAVGVGKSVRRLRVSGARAIDVGADGAIRFSTAEAFHTAPIDWREAYGGCDHHARIAGGHVVREGLYGGMEPVGLFAYPRNASGVGYYIDVDRSRASGQRLPRVEDPLDLLTPDRLFLPSPVSWMRAPISAGFGWVAPYWYPRIERMLGPVVARQDGDVPREASLGDGDDLERLLRPATGCVHPRAAQGAAPGLACERLRGDEIVALQNLHPEHPEVRFSLPGERPSVRVKPPDLRTFEPEAFLQTVRLYPDRNRVSLTWCAAIPLYTRPMPDFLDQSNLSVTWS